MNKHVFAVGFLIAVASAASAAVTTAEIERAVNGIGGYEVGKVRGPLTEMERVVRMAASSSERAMIEKELVKLLEGDSATLEGKNFVCELLARIGTDVSVPVLAGMLQDAKTVDMACLALAANPSEAAAKALREAMEKSKGKGLVAVVSALGDRKDGGSVALMGRLIANEDRVVAEAATSAIGRIGGTEAARVLASARRAASGRMKDVVSGAYLQCGIGLGQAGKKAEGTAICRELLGEGESAVCRRGALVALINMSGADAVPVILAAMSGKDRMLQATAIAQIRIVEGREVTERFAQELARVPDDLKVLLIGALGDRGDAAARGAVAAAAASDNAQVRVAAIKAMGRLGDWSSVAILAKAAAEGASETERRAGLLSLRRLSGDGVDIGIVEAMKAAKGLAKAQLIEVLSDRGATSAVDALLVEARGGEARAAAMKALGQLAGPDVLPAVVDILVKMGDHPAKGDAERATVAVSKKQAEVARRADPVLAVFGGTQGEAKASLVRVLGGIANEKAFEAVKQSLADPDEVVKGAAVRAMADWPDERAVVALLQICRTTQDETHRIVALRGAVRLLRVLGGQPRAATVKAYEDVMGAAKRAEEKKLVLGGLTGLAHPAALRIAGVCLSDAAVGAEAAVAIVNVGDRIKGAYREEVAAAMKKVLAAEASANVKEQAKAILAQIDKFGDYVTAWQVCGPFSEAGKTNVELFGMEFAVDDAGWQVLAAGADSARPMVMSLSSLFPGDHRVAYVKTFIRSETDQEARIELGVDDAAKIWVNEKVVLANNTAGACVPGAQKADVVLKKGWNAVRMKVVQATGPWEFCVRICKRNGERLEGISASCVMPGGEVVWLFDGKTFEGWDGPVNVFRIEDGAIVGGSLKGPVARNEFLTTKREYGDFELRLKFKAIGKGVNAGIQIRSRRIANHNEMIGYQADIGDGYWGCLYDESRRNRVLATADATELQKVLKKEDWNEYVIRCEGRRISLWINGLQTVDYVEADGNIEQRGVIGLQIHGGGPSEAWYKDIQIEELKQ